MSQSSLEKIVQEEVPILRKGYSYLRSAVLGLALSVSLQAQLTFTQSSSTTLLDQKVIGTAIKNDGFVDNIYVAVDGDVQKYSTSFSPIGSSIPDLTGLQNYMNSGLDNKLTFSTLSSGIRDMNISDSTPSGSFYGSLYAFSISKQVVSGGNTYLLLFDTALNGVSLYNKTTNSSTFLFSSLDLGTNTNWLVDFAEVDETNIMNSNFIAARQDGFIEEVNLSNGLTGYTGLVPVISGGQLVSISVNNGTSLWSSYDANAGDFGASQLNYGSFTGFSPAGSVVPESSTYGALFMGVSAFLLALRKKGHLKNLISKINDYKNSKLKTSDCSVEFATNTFSKNDSLNLFFVHDCLESRVNNLRKLDVNYFEPPPLKSRFENLSYTAANYS